MAVHLCLDVSNSLTKESQSGVGVMQLKEQCNTNERTEGKWPEQMGKPTYDLIAMALPFMNVSLT
jgi:hypothetical protein